MNILLALVLFKCSLGSNVWTNEKGFVGWYKDDDNNIVRMFFSKNDYSYCGLEKPKGE